MFWLLLRNLNSVIIIRAPYWFIVAHMGGCQNYGPFLGTQKIRCRINYNRNQKGTIILTTTHIMVPELKFFHSGPGFLLLLKRKGVAEVNCSQVSKKQPNPSLKALGPSW